MYFLLVLEILDGGLRADCSTHIPGSGVDGFLRDLRYSLTSVLPYCTAKSRGVSPSSLVTSVQVRDYTDSIDVGIHYHACTTYIDTY